MKSTDKVALSENFRAEELVYLTDWFEHVNVFPLCLILI